MRGLRLVLLGLPLLVSACGSSAAPPALSVTCNGSLALTGATSIDVSSNSGGSGAVLTFPDPANAGHTGTIPITAGERCSIAPALNVAK